MARAILIFNPVAARTDARIVRAVAQVFERAGWVLDVEGTNRPEHATELAAQAVAAGVDTVAVYGGDGTAMQAVGGTVGSDVPIGLIPGGTGNVLARNLRLPLNPTKAAQVVVRGTPRAVDLGRLERGGTMHYFAAAAGAGYDAEVMAKTTAKAKRRWKLAAYWSNAIATVARDLKTSDVCVTVDDHVIEGPATTVIALNCSRLFPPYLPMWKGVEPDDGVLDVLVIHSTGLIDGLGIVWESVIRGASPSGRIRHARGRTVRIESAEPRLVQYDGEVEGNTPVRFDVMPGGLRVLAPA